jgi:hypothetical protein
MNTHAYIMCTYSQVDHLSIQIELHNDRTYVYTCKCSHTPCSHMCANSRTVSGVTDLRVYCDIGLLRNNQCVTEALDYS